MTTLCPICKTPQVNVEKRSAPFLVVEGYMDAKALKQGVTISRELWYIISSELNKAGLNPYEFCRTTVWLHEKRPRRSKLDRELYAKCETHFLKTIMEVSTGKKGVLLVGADATKLLTEVKVSQNTGLQVSSPYISSDVPVFCAEKPGETIGEFRLAVSRFAKHIKSLTSN